MCLTPDRSATSGVYASSPLCQDVLAAELRQQLTLAQAAAAASEQRMAAAEERSQQLEVALNESHATLQQRNAEYALVNKVGPCVCVCGCGCLGGGGACRVRVASHRQAGGGPGGGDGLGPSRETCIRGPASWGCAWLLSHPAWPPRCLPGAGAGGDQGDVPAAAEGQGAADRPQCGAGRAGGWAEETVLKQAGEELCACSSGRSRLP